MVFTIPKEKILAQLLLQLRAHFLVSEDEEGIIEQRLDYALSSCEENFSHSENKYYFSEVGGGEIV